MTTSPEPRRRRWRVAAVTAVAVALAGTFLLQHTRSPGDGAASGAHVESSADIPVGIAQGGRLTSMSDAELTRALDDVVALHATWIRMDVAWPDIQPDGPDAWRWDDVDRVVDAAAARGVQVLAILTYTPPWARVAGCTTAFCAPADPADFARFAGGAAQHFGHRVAAYELWNEPNLDVFWTTPDAIAYGNLVRATTPAIRAASPDATIVLGGLSAGQTDDTIDAAKFLRRACAASCDVDAVAYHPYSYPALPLGSRATSWDRMLDGTSNRGLRRAMADVDLADTTIWVTEMGAPTGGGTPGVDQVSEGDQATTLDQTLRASLADPGVGGWFWYTWRDLDDYGSVEDHFGLVRRDGGHKRAYDTMRKLLQP